METQSDYSKYRGKCKEMAEAAVKADATLTLVRGWYWCPITNRKEQHWWCKRPDGSILDPTAKQFASKGQGEYEDFDGYFECEHCGDSVHEDYVIPCGNYQVCSVACAKRLLGL